MLGILRSHRRIAIIKAVIYLNSGEWWPSNLLFGVVFLVASLGIVGIGWWVLRGDKLNRIASGVDLPDSTDHSTAQGH